MTPVSPDISAVAVPRRGATHSPHLEQVGEVAGERERQPDLERTVAVVLNAQALIGGTAPEEQRAHDVQHVLGQHKLLIEIDVGVGQVDGEVELSSRTLEPSSSGCLPLSSISRCER